MAANPQHVRGQMERPEREPTRRLGDGIVADELRLLLFDYGNAVLALSRGQDEHSIAAIREEATRSGRAVLARLLGRAALDQELAEVLGLDHLVELCRGVPP